MTGARARGPLAAILGLGAALRAAGLGFGLPFLSNFYVRPDETLVILPALQMFGGASADVSLVYPALTSTLLAALYHAGFGVARAAGATAPALAAHFVTDPTPYVLAGRAVSVVAGTVTVGLVYLAGRELSHRVGVLAALLYAVAPLAVRDAHFAVTDTLMTMLAAAAVWALLRYHAAAAPSARRWLVTAALFVGLAVATKYPAGVLGVLALGVVAARHGAHRDLARDGALLVAGGALVFAAANASMVIRFRETLAEVAWVVRAVSRQEGGWSAGRALGGVLGLLRYGPGELVGLAAAAVAIGLAVRHREHLGRVAIVAAAAGVFLGPLLVARILPFRYALPALPFLAVLAAHGLLARPASRWLTALAIAACVLPPLARSVWIDALLARDDTRTLAGAWIAAHAPAGAPVVLLGGPECEPQIRETRASLARRIEHATALYGDHGGRIVSALYRLQLERAPDGRERDVFRGRVTLERGGDGIAVVRASYPLAIPGCAIDAEAPADVIAAASAHVRFDALAPAARGGRADRVDAFFLPFSRLWEVRRPGPNLDVWLVPAYGVRP